MDSNMENYIEDSPDSGFEESKVGGNNQNELI
jgi:hypothetical protein